MRDGDGTASYNHKFESKNLPFVEQYPSNRSKDNDFMNYLTSKLGNAGGDNADSSNNNYRDPVS